jgi:ATP-dependent Clp protease ATP-binding subunit ClpA
LSCAVKHKICIDKINCVFAGDLKIGDVVIDAVDNVHVVTDIQETNETLFYDMTVESDTHLYQTSNNLIHHNTETAVQIASTMGIPLVKFDMSEYMERHSVSRLIGSPPGYVGFDEGSGLLINAIDASPSCVLLLDEVEKAHPDILNILLQVMDTGKLTSSSGKEINFRNVILIMTSNAGAAALEKNSIGFAKSDQPAMNDEAIKRMFAPEFRNRLDAIVPYGKLKPEVMSSIVDKFMVNLNKLSAERNVQIVLDEASRNWLAIKGYDPQYGARPLNRVIHENISKPLSREMLFGKLQNGGIANVTVLDDKLIIA